VTEEGAVPADLLTTAEAARLIGVSRRTLQRYVERGWLVPTMTLPTGYHRWSRDCLIRQFRELIERRRRGEITE
jgi:excisionase family DNA binding protein